MENVPEWLSFLLGGGCSGSVVTVACQRVYSYFVRKQRADTQNKLIEQLTERIDQLEKQRELDVQSRVECMRENGLLREEIASLKNEVQSLGKMILQMESKRKRVVAPK